LLVAVLLVVVHQLLLLLRLWVERVVVAVLMALRQEQA
jgi:hypothetical protein